MLGPGSPGARRDLAALKTIHQEVEEDVLRRVRPRLPDLQRRKGRGRRRRLQQQCGHVKLDLTPPDAHPQGFSRYFQKVIRYRYSLHGQKSNSLPLPITCLKK